MFIGLLLDSRILKFIYSEKATKFCKISTLDLTVLHTVKSKVEILQNFVGNDVAASSQTSPTHTCHVKALVGFKDSKSVNLEYNTLVCWADGKNDSWTKDLMFQVLFFHKILQNSSQKPFHFIFL